MEELKPCACGNTNLRTYSYSKVWLVECEKCKRRTTPEPTKRAAELKWNIERRLERLR